ncbi:nucleotidyltransferase [Ekhidna sp.]|uniref:nucleotidyltransferase n=1 Tax=Ekhidna sp. TaxID=2608089 RepID=UPI003CCC1A48
MADLFNQDFLEYLQLLNNYEVEYVLLGGMAVNIHGYRRSTGDMDLFVNPTLENHNRLKKVHQKFGMMMGEMGDLENFLNTQKYDVYTFGVSPIQIDVMTACRGITFDEAFTNAELYPINEVSIRVINYETLLKTKKATKRTRDLADIEELKKIKKQKK